MGLTKVTYAMIEGAVVNVLDYGADPTGSDDSTAAIQTALDSGAGVVYVPQGSYKITSTLEIPTNTWLQGAYGNAVKYDPTDAVCKLVYTGTDTTAIKFLSDANGASASKLSNIVIQQTSATANVIAIRIGDSTDTPTYTLSTFIEDVLIADFTGKGVYNYGSWNCTLNNVMVHGAETPNRTDIGFHFDNAASGATSCCLTNCFAEECDVGFEIGSTSSSGRAYSYSSLVNTYVDGCTSGYRFLGSGTTRVFQVFNAGIEVVDGGNAIYVDGCAVNFNGLSMFPNGTGFTYVIEAANSANLSINDGDFIPGTGFAASSTAIVKADNSVIRFINTRLTDVAAERVETNGGRIDVITYDQNLYKFLERTTAKAIDVTVATRNLTYTGYSKYAVSTSAGANQQMAGLPIVNVSNIANNEIITFVNTDTTYKITLVSENVTAGTGIVKHPLNTSANGIELQAQDVVMFVKKSDGKLYELKEPIY